MRSTLSIAPPAPVLDPETAADTAPEEITTPCPIERPRFFCGQLLLDEDLGALVDWTRGRLGRGRLRHGWGVVCGLDVRCDPEVESQILVGPGYAVGPGGEDIRVCAETAVDLAAVCREEPKECEGFEIQPPDPVRRLVDLYIRYRELETAPRPNLQGICQPSRIEEGFEIDWQRAEAEGGANGAGTAAQRWLDRVQQRWAEIAQRVELVRGLYGSAAHDQDIQAVREELRAWLADLPVNRFAFLRDWIEDRDLAAEAQLIELLFWLVLDDRSAVLTCACAGPPESPGVPLARLCVATQPCRVLSVDPHPPHRLPLRADCWPAPLGRVNLGRFVWHRLDEVRLRLADLGVPIREIRELVPTAFDDLGQLLDSDLFAVPFEALTLETFEPDADVEICLPRGRRVVSFRPQVGLAVRKGANVDAARQGDVVRYLFEVRNTGGEALDTVRLEDDLLDEISLTGPLGPRQVAEVSRDYRVEQASGMIVNRVRAFGETPEGAQVASAADVHELAIIEAPPQEEPDADFKLIGFMKALGFGQLDYVQPIYLRGASTYTDFLTLTVEDFVDMYPAVRKLDETGSAEPLVEEWKSFARNLRSLQLFTAQDVVDKAPGIENLPEELYRGTPISELNWDHRTKVFLHRAAGRAALQAREPQRRGVPKETRRRAKLRPPARPKAATVDDFLSIGLDRRQALKLQAAGIRTFGDLAGASLETLHDVFPRTDAGKLKTWKRKARPRARAKE